MTVSSETTRNDYTGNGVTTEFAYSFRIWSDTDLLVVTADGDGVETTLELTTDYTVAGAGLTTGGSITLSSPLASGHKLVILSAIPALQGQKLSTQSGFRAEVQEASLDKLTIISQQLKEKLSRAITVPITSDATPDELVNDLFGAEVAAAASASASATSASAASASASSAAGSASAAAASAAAAAASAAEAGPVSSIAGADGAVGLAVISEGGSVTTTGNNISVNIKAKPRGLLIIAHRGYADLGPQNTMSAFTAAAASGATVLELDVQVTSDGQLVVFHDDDMTALTGGALTGTVASHTWAEMQNIDVGTHYSPIFASSRIPLFSEFLAFAKKAGVQFWAEIKNYRTSADVTLIVNAVVAAGVEHLCVMQSFNLSDLTAVRAISKAVGLNHAMNAADYSADGAALAALGGEVWRSTSTTRITAASSYVATLQALGVKVAAYTPTRSLYVQDMQDYGIDAVFVDRYLPSGV